MSSVPGLRVVLHAPQKKQFSGVCTELESSDQEVVALVSFRSGKAPALGIGDSSRLSFLGSGMFTSIDTDGIVVLRTDSPNQRCYSFQLEDVPKSLLLLQVNRRGSTRLSPSGAIRVQILGLPEGIPSRVTLHDVSAHGLSILVPPQLEKLLVNQVQLRYSLQLPGEDTVELVAAIRHRRMCGAQVLYGLEFDGNLPSFLQTQERFLSYLATLR